MKPLSEKSRKRKIITVDVSCGIGTRESILIDEDDYRSIERVVEDFGEKRFTSYIELEEDSLRVHSLDLNCSGATPTSVETLGCGWGSDG